jgi:hypothetical protein
MVSQIYYKFLVNGDQYTLIGIAGGDLVAPEQFGVESMEPHTDLRRGYVALYELTPEALYLRGLTLKGENGHYQAAGSSKPVRDFFQATYHGPSVVIPFTGKIRIAKGFINEPYVNMGYQKAIAFRTVFDITLKNGLLVEVKDRSSEMEQKRGAFKEYYNSLSRLEQTLYAFNLDVELEQG